MQCKDIPERPVLEFLRDIPDFPGIPGTKQNGTWFWEDDFKPENSVLHAMPAGTAPKLGLAKMRGLIRRGFVDGRGCGCRGNFVLTPKGLEHINAGDANG